MVNGIAINAKSNELLKRKLKSEEKCHENNQSDFEKDEDASLLFSSLIFPCCRTINILLEEWRGSGVLSRQMR